MPSVSNSIPLSTRPIRNMPDAFSGSLQSGVVLGFGSRSSFFLKPRQLPNHMSTVIQTGQHMCFALTADSLRINVFCIGKTRTRDLSSVIQLTVPNVSSSYLPSTSGDEVFQAVGQRGVRMALRIKDQEALSDWIRVNKRL